MLKLKSVAVAVASLTALLSAAQLLAGPAVPLAFLEGARLESESEILPVSPIASSLMRTSYLVRGTPAEIASKADEELLALGWDRAEVLGELRFCGHGWLPSRGVTIEDAGDGFCDVEVRSESGLFDRLRLLLGLAKSPPDSMR